METTPLASLSLTHVHYNPADPLSYLCAWLALVPQALCVIYVTLIWSTREIEILLMFTGQLGCEALNFLLKRLIKEERPKQMYGKGYGMPSSHAQFLAYFATSLSLFLLLLHHPPAQHYRSERPYSHKPLNLPQKISLSLLTFFLAAAVAASRVYLNYHTPTQVLVGCIAGGVSGLSWFVFTECLRRMGWLEWGLETWLGRMGRWRDLVVEEDLAEAGWRVWEERRDKRRRVDGVGGKKRR
ncbi:hypothetical protein JMJ35_004817 [Cladonia borealis]|uniref:Dolichyldiphosphatase n=1 Tax=Cladonia borealis TaxID=184061 RepID=A0AA39R0X9_9LECA|nr:hypothetical protein JMJ35_004817 [Cladonia borealis]